MDNSSLMRIEAKLLGESIFQTALRWQQDDRPFLWSDMWKAAGVSPSKRVRIESRITGDPIITTLLRIGKELSEEQTIKH